MTRFVLDASVAVKWYLLEDHSEDARRYWGLLGEIPLDMHETKSLAGDASELAGECL